MISHYIPAQENKFGYYSKVARALNWRWDQFALKVIDRWACAVKKTLSFYWACMQELLVNLKLPLYTFIKCDLEGQRKVPLNHNRMKKKGEKKGID